MDKPLPLRCSESHAGYMEQVKEDLFAHLINNAAIILLSNSLISNITLKTLCLRWCIRDITKSGWQTLFQVENLDLSCNIFNNDVISSLVNPLFNNRKPFYFYDSNDSCYWSLFFWMRMGQKWYLWGTRCRGKMLLKISMLGEQGITIVRIEE